MTLTASVVNKGQTPTTETPKGPSDLEGLTFGVKCVETREKQTPTGEQRYTAITLPPDSVYQRIGNVAGNITVLDSFQRTYGAVPDDAKVTRYLPTFAVALSHADPSVRLRAVQALADVGTNHNATVPPALREGIRWRLNQLGNDTNQTPELGTAATAAFTALAPPR